MRSVRRFLDDACAAAATREFLSVGDRRLTYGEFAQQTDSLAAALIELGLRPGDRLAIALPSGAPALLTWLAAAKVGIVSCPLHPELAPPERDRALAWLDAAGLVTDTATLAQVTVSPRPKVVLLTDRESQAGTLELEPLLHAGAVLRDVAEPDPTAPSEILTTSGTTGAPKGALLSGRMAVLTGEAFAAWLALRADDRLFTCLPLSHINARFYSTLGAIAARAALTVAPRFSASRFWEQLAAARATQCNLIGAMVKILLDRAPPAAEQIEALRLIYAAPALREAEHREFEARTGARLVIGYGLTESTFGFIHPLDETRLVESIGRPRRHPDPQVKADWRLVVDGTRAAATDESAEIWLRSDATFSGYFRDDAATAAAFDGDWFRTGDLARRDAAGNVWFVGRAKLVIRRRGENLTPGEVEAVLERHPDVVEAAVIGIPGALGEDEVRAYVVLRVGARFDISALRQHCAAELAAFKLPSEWRVLERLPRTTTQRIAYHLLPR